MKYSIIENILKEARIAATEKCPNCGFPNMRVKDHGTWEGYHCSKCGVGGSRQKKKLPQYKLSPMFRRPKRPYVNTHEETPYEYENRQERQHQAQNEIINSVLKEAKIAAEIIKEPTKVGQVKGNYKGINYRITTEKDKKKGLWSIYEGYDENFRIIFAMSLKEFKDKVEAYLKHQPEYTPAQKRYLKDKPLLEKLRKKRSY